MSVNVLLHVLLLLKLMKTGNCEFDQWDEFLDLAHPDGAALGVRLEEPLGAELLGVGEDLGVVEDAVDVGHDVRALGDGVTEEAHFAARERGERVLVSDRVESVGALISLPLNEQQGQR